MKPSWHRFRCLDRLFVYDIGSGSFHEIDEAGYDILGSVDSVDQLQDPTYVTETLSWKYPPEVIREVFSELAELAAEGLLGAPDKGLELALPEGDKPIKALCLHIAHACNISCRYCFASSGTFGGKRTLMSREVALSAIDLLLDQPIGRKHYEVDFFGGEPLLNWDVVKEAIEYGSAKAGRLGKVLKFTLTTNGIALNDEIISYLDEHNVAVVLSLDGRKDVNDRMRQHYGAEEGKSVYSRIVPKFQQLCRSRKGQGYYVRGTYTHYNLDFLEDIKHIASLGFDQISVEPVIAAASDDYAIRLSDIPAICDEYDRLTEWLIGEKRNGREIMFFHYNLNLDRGPCVAKRVSGCGAGNEYFAVTPEGDLYPCHQFVGREEYKIGSIKRGLEKVDLRKKFAECNLISKETCKDCWARYFCGGGCHANAQLFSGTLEVPHELSCILQRKRVECALAMYAALNG